MADFKAAFKRLEAAHVQGHVVGLKEVAGIKPRLDIDVLMRDDPDCFNLFVLAFLSLKKEGDRMGYFEIAGIHGLPKRPWDEVNGKDLGDTTDAGYCAHSKVTFPTWHRVYLAMLEQSIFLQMHDLVKHWSQEHRKKYTDAAQRFRLPYWDYWRPRGKDVTFDGVFENMETHFEYDYKCPLIFTSDKINVRVYPDDELIVLHKDNQEFGMNPFFEYRFDKHKFKTKEFNLHDLSEELFSHEKTVRYPEYLERSNPVDTLNLVLNNVREGCNGLGLTLLRDTIYRNYYEFSTNNWPDSGLDKTHPITQATPRGSLEGIHNAYHGLIGGSAPMIGKYGGHMSRVPVAAFDPIFWFHHGQIERMFSIWQAIHDQEKASWFTEGDQADKQANKPLLPFRLDDTKFWSSENARTTDRLGYTYSEISHAGGETTSKKIEEMYTWSVRSEDRNYFLAPPDYMLPIEVEDLIFFKGIGGHQKESVELAPAPKMSFQRRVTHDALPAVNDYSFEWYIDDKVQRLAFDGAFTIYYFISNRSDGSAPGPSEDLLRQGSLAGINHVFAAPAEACDNCGRQNEQAHIIRNTVAVTSLLLDYVELGQLESMKPEHVKPFLIARLKWRVLTINGVVADPRKMAEEKDLEINVSCKKARLPRDSGDVTYENYPEIISAIVGRGSPTQDSR